MPEFARAAEQGGTAADALFAPLLRIDWSPRADDSLDDDEDDDEDMEAGGGNEQETATTTTSGMATRPP